MKKVLLLFMAFVFVRSLNAQFIKNYGVKIGIATSDQYVREHLPFDDFDPTIVLHPNRNYIGFTIGLNAELMNYSPFSLVFECNYIQKGFRDEFTAGKMTYHMKSRFDYLSISLLTQTKMSIGIIDPYLLIGPRIDAEISITGDVIYNKHNKYVPGLVVGIGSEIPLNNIKFLAEITYDFNFGYLYENSDVTVSYESYVFRLGIIL